MAAKLTRLTHKITIQLHQVAQSCTIGSSRSRRSVRKILVTPSYLGKYAQKREMFETGIMYFNKAHILPHVHLFALLTVFEIFNKFPFWLTENRLTL
jgi:hypothetical protein